MGADTHHVQSIGHGCAEAGRMASALPPFASSSTTGFWFPSPPLTSSKVGGWLLLAGEPSTIGEMEGSGTCADRRRAVLAGANQLVFPTDLVLYLLAGAGVVGAIGDPSVALDQCPLGAGRLRFSLRG